MTTNEEKVKQRERLLAKNKLITDRCDKEDRDVTTAEHDEWSANFAMIDSLGAELDEAVAPSTNANMPLRPGESIMSI